MNKLTLIKNYVKAQAKELMVVESDGRLLHGFLDDGIFNGRVGRKAVPEDIEILADQFKEGGDGEYIGDAFIIENKLYMYDFEADDYLKFR